MESRKSRCTEERRTEKEGARLEGYKRLDVKRLFQSSFYLLQGAFCNRLQEQIIDAR